MKEIRKIDAKKITTLYPFPKTQKNNGKNDKPLRVAAYCRVSTGSDEQLVSYHAQVKHYEQTIRARPDYELVGIFADEGLSGTDCRKREAFNRLMETARNGQLDLIITKSLSRFGRNTLDSLKNLRELKTLGVDVFFEKENIHTLQSEGEMLLTLISAVAQNESLNLSENVKWGIHRKYERGNVQSIPSGKFLGYKKDKHGNLIIDEDESAVVRRIYQMFLGGLGTYQIAKALTLEGVPMTFGGKEWCADHINKVLNNEKYQGDTLFQKTFNADYLTKRRVKNKGQLPQYYIKDTHPAIIDRETWSLVQLEFARQKQYAKAHFVNKYHLYSEEYALSGKIICQVCGHFLRMDSSKRKSDFAQKYWACKKYRAGRYLPDGSDACCNSQRIYAKKIEEVFVDAWNQLVDALSSDEQLLLADGNFDQMTTYRRKDLDGLLREMGHMDKIPSSLLIRVLDHIQVDPDGRLTVVFLCGLCFTFH